MEAARGARASRRFFPSMFAAARSTCRRSKSELRGFPTHVESATYSAYVFVVRRKKRQRLGGVVGFGERLPEVCSASRVLHFSKIKPTAAPSHCLVCRSRTSVSQPRFLPVRTGLEIFKGRWCARTKLTPDEERGSLKENIIVVSPAGFFTFSQLTSLRSFRIHFHLDQFYLDSIALRLFRFRVVIPPFLTVGRLPEEAYRVEGTDGIRSTLNSTG